MEVEVRPATLEDIHEIIPIAREIDKEEAYAATGEDISEALELTFLISSTAWAGLVDGKLVTVFGVAVESLFEGKGQPWLVATDDLVKYQVAFLRRNKLFLDHMKEGFPYLHNWVDERNVIAKRWLKWMGFEMSEIMLHGPMNTPFRHFEMRA